MLGVRLLPYACWQSDCSMMFTSAFWSRLVREPETNVNMSHIVKEWHFKIYTHITYLNIWNILSQQNVLISDITLTSLPHGAPASNVALSVLQKAVYRRGEANQLDCVGPGCWDSHLQQGHIIIHVGTVEARVQYDPLDGDNQSSHPGPQHWTQTHWPGDRVGVTTVMGWGQWADDLTGCFGRE